MSLRVLWASVVAAPLLAGCGAAQVEEKLAYEGVLPGDGEATAVPGPYRSSRTIKESQLILVSALPHPNEATKSEESSLALDPVGYYGGHQSARAVRLEMPGLLDTTAPRTENPNVAIMPCFGEQSRRVSVRFWAVDASTAPTEVIAGSASFSTASCTLESRSQVRIRPVVLLSSRLYAWAEGDSAVLLFPEARRLSSTNDVLAGPVTLAHLPMNAPGASLVAALTSGRHEGASAVTSCFGPAPEPAPRAESVLQVDVVEQPEGLALSVTLTGS
jgi:hypothetical protein